MLGVASAMVIAFATPPALAQAASAAKQTLSLEAQPLGEALIEISDAFGTTVLATESMVAGKRAPLVSGTYSIQEAIDATLAGSGLIASPNAAGDFIVMEASAPQAEPTLPVRGAEPTQPEESMAMDTIVVKGRFQNSLVNRLPIDPRELPFAIDLVGEAEIDKRGFFDPNDILRTVPNVAPIATSFSLNFNRFGIRGFEASVLTNNRPISFGFAGQRENSFIERLEVARGPSSILLGPVRPGGVINQVTKSPEQHDFVELTLRGGSFGTFRSEVDANTGAILGNEALRGRITVAYEDLGTPQDGVNQETFAVRPVVELDFTDRTRAQLSVGYVNRDGSSAQDFPVFRDTGEAPDVITPEFLFGPPGADEGEDLFIDGEVQHEFLDDLKLVLRGSYQDTETRSVLIGLYAYEYIGDEFTPGISPDEPVLEYFSDPNGTDQQGIFGDAQLLGGFELFGQRQDWVLGGGYQRTERDFLFGEGAGVLFALDAIEEAAPPTLDAGAGVEPFFSTTEDLYSVYAETNIRPTDRLTIAAGLRYDNVTNENNFDGAISFNDVTFRIGATYEITSALNGYSSYAQSFIPQEGTTRSGERLQPEGAENFELGLKGSVLNGRISGTAAVFHLTRDNVATEDPENMIGEVFSLPIGETRHVGVELNTNIEITQAFDLDLSYGYTDTEVRSVTGTIDGFPLEVGDPVPLAPEHTFSVFGTYTVLGGLLDGLRFGAGVRGISERPAPAFDLVYDGYTVVDALISYPIRDNIQVQVNALNLLDNTYFDNTGFLEGSPGGGFRYGSPRGVFATLRARF